MTAAPTDKRTRILDAAVGCFARVGLVGARISDIAAAAGVGKGTVYEYFRSKEELLLACCLHSCARTEAEIGAASGTAQPGAYAELVASGVHPVRAMHRVLSAVIRGCLGRRREEQRLFAELANLGHSHPELAVQARASIGPRQDGWRSQAEELYRLGLAAGCFRPLADPGSAARLIVAAVDGLIWQQQWDGEQDIDALAGQIADTWCRLLLSEPQRLEEFLA